MAQVRIDRMTLSDLGDVLHQPEGEDAYLDPSSGMVHRSFGGETIGDDGDPLDEIPDDWISVGGEFAHKSYGDMVTFTVEVTEPKLRHRIEDALEGRGAFRRFRDIVHNTPQMIGRIWNRYCDALQMRRAVGWLAGRSLIDDRQREAWDAEITGELNGTIAELRAVLDEELEIVIASERELQTPEVRGDPARLEDLLADDFTEVGASGRLWRRDEVLSLLAEEGADAAPIEVGDITARRLGEDTMLVAWQSDRAGRRAHRRSVWVRSDGGWRLEHHQGTLIADTGGVEQD